MARRLPMTRGRILALLILAAAFVFVAAARWSGTLAPHDIADAIARAQTWATAHPFAAPIAFGLAYLVCAILALPGVWTLGVAGGAIFGPWLGVPLIAGSSALAATCAMLSARLLFRDLVAARYPKLVARLDSGGARTLFAARLAPLVPYALVNLAAGLTRMPALTFLTVSLVGSLPLALIYGLAGDQLSIVRDPVGLLSPPVVAALLGLALAPFAAKALADRRARRA